MGVGLGIAQVVDRHHLQFRALAALVQCTQYVAADAAVAVDAHLDCHA
jgi:hypothetical protein